ncbi:hypothetical protein Emag_002855 [Eimeria magna]
MGALHQRPSRWHTSSSSSSSSSSGSQGPFTEALNSKGLEASIEKSGDLQGLALGLSVFAAAAVVAAVVAAAAAAGGGVAEAVCSKSTGFLRTLLLPLVGHSVVERAATRRLQAEQQQQQQQQIAVL